MNKRLTGVILEEINRFGGFALAFGKVLANLEGEKRIKLELSFFDDAGGFDKHRNSSLETCVLPAFKGFPGSL